MKTPIELLPDTPTLARGLMAALATDANGDVEILDRKMHSRASTFPLEIVRCRLGRSREIEVVCKYSADTQNSCYGHRGGIPYEAEVYRSVLRRSVVSVPPYLGSFRDPDTGWTWLIIGYLRGAGTSGESKHGLSRAAQWLGRFHAVHQGFVDADAALRVYDFDYYSGWAERTRAFTRPFAADLPWIDALCTRFIEKLPLLLDQPRTVVHGEFYSKNVLVDDDAVYPVDWEAAALGQGEVDLASIIEKWPEETVASCLAAYRQARWPDGWPAGHERALDVAQVYWLFRWLGDTETRTHKRLPKRIALLRAAAARWGVL